ncbi:hypothetical protein RDV89_17165 [Nocardioides zeae]|uniref:Uncharacterized protein n=1 Tax=Nocardioides imazamoxiresistens TaxID=3231893 RepID=A0ABU3PZY9_9ACTN|nr:hypothetical protein [Nocardioides zeae]MDT9594821.1 hypothetical protein [Nocardioides zeae]
MLGSLFTVAFVGFWVVGLILSMLAVVLGVRLRARFERPDPSTGLWSWVSERHGVGPFTTLTWAGMVGVLVFTLGLVAWAIPSALG